MKRQISIFALLLSAFAAVGTAAEATTQTVSGGYYYVGAVYAGRNIQRMSIDGAGVSYTAQNLAEGKPVTFKASPDKGMEISDWGTCVGDRGGSLIQNYTNVRWEQRTLDYYDWSSKPSDGPGYLVVRFDYKKFDVTFDRNGGTSKEPEDIKGQIITSTIPLPSVTRDGYEFAGWKNAKGDVFQAGNTSGEAFWNDEERKFYADLTAQWAGGTYAVTINPGAGAGGECDGYTVSDQAQTRIVTPPTQEGHTIQSWQVSGATGGSPWVNEENVLTIPANTYGNLTLTPTWKADTFTITYKPGSGTPGDERTDTKIWGVSKALRDKTYEDPRGQYVQDGWNTTKESFDGAAEYGLKAGYTDNASITLYPHWKLNGYKLTIHHKGAYYDGKLLEETALEPLVVGTTNLNEILVAVPTNGAAFYGYYSTEGGNTKIYDEHGKCCKVEGVWSEIWPNGTFAGNANLEVWAKWGPPPAHCNISAVCAPTVGGTVEPASTNVVKGKDVTLTAKENPGYSFCCWTNSATGLSTTDNPWTFTVTADETYTAVFTGNVYTVTFVDVYGGNPAANVTVQVGRQWKSFFPPMTYAGHVLTGWYTFFPYESGNKIDGDADVPPPATKPPIYLYAKWEEVATYTIAYDGNEATSGTMEPQTAICGVETALTSNKYVRTGYDFAGWTNKVKQAFYEDGAKVTDLASAKQTVTLLAVWTPHTYTVTFDKNGGEGDQMPGQPFTYDVEQSLSSNKYTNGKNTFAGWATTSSGEVAYADGAKVVNLTDENGATVRLFAKWEKLAYTNNALSVAADCDHERDDDGRQPLDLISESTDCVSFDVADMGGNNKAVRMMPTSELASYLKMEVQLSGSGTLKFHYRTSIPYKSNSSLKFVFNNDYVPDLECSTSVDDWTEYVRHYDAAEGTMARWSFEEDIMNNDYALIDNIRWIPDGAGPKYADDDTPVTGFSMVDGKLVFAFDATNDVASTYHLLGTNDLVAPMPWPMVFETNKASGTIRFDIPVKADEPKMFYRIRELK